jgi:uncharacterized protein (DUF924 family)
VRSWADEILAYWFGLDPKQWWFDKSLDSEIDERSRALWESKRQCPAETFLGSPSEALAAVLLFDQFPRNMFRGPTDHLGLQVAKAAIDRGFDEKLSGPERGFLYMPFQHSESLDDQERSIGLFTALGDSEQLRFAKLHHEIIERYGRFPHRNAVLGRAPRPEEIAAGDVVPW